MVPLVGFWAYIAPHEKFRRFPIDVAIVSANPRGCWLSWSKAEGDAHVTVKPPYNESGCNDPRAVTIVSPESNFSVW